MVKMERKKILIIKTLTKNKDTVKRLKINIQSGPLNTNLRRNKKLFTLRGVLNKT